ncbi:MAG: hypothetical protein G01um101449_397, partial [Parcubacteria group bacterium Gr01-1014_49]
PVAAVVIGALIWFVNIPGMNASTGLILAMTPAAEGPGGNIRLFTDLAAQESFASQEIREQLISFAAMVVRSSQTTDQEKQQAAALAVSEMQKQVARYPLDARERLQLAYAYRVIGNGTEALKEIREAARLSPGKQEILIQEGALAWDLGQVEEAHKAFTKAYALSPQFESLAVYAAVGNIAIGNTEAADAILLDVYGSVVVDNDILAVAYYRTHNWPRLITLWKLRADKPGAPVDVWFSLAAAYYAAGEKSSALKTINKAISIYPEAASAAASAIAQIEGRAVGQ